MKQRAITKMVHELTRGLLKRRFLFDDDPPRVKELQTTYWNWRDSHEELLCGDRDCDLFDAFKAGVKYAEGDQQERVQVRSDGN